MKRIKFNGIGTEWTVDIPVDTSDRKVADLRKLIVNFEDDYSRFKDTSYISKFAKDYGTFEVPSTFYPLFKFYHDLYIITGGKFSPFLGGLLSDLGYDRAYTFLTKEKNLIRNPPKWDEVIEDYNEQQIVTKNLIQMDFGAAGKGYLLDLVGKFLLQKGLGDFILDAGGDILLSPRSNQGKKLRVGLENPVNTQEAIGFVELNKGAICASAGNRRKWGNFNHILDPLKLDSTRNVLATWVIADTAMVADGLATCLFFCDPKKLVEAGFKFEYAVVNSDGSARVSPNFSGELF